MEDSGGRKEVIQVVPRGRAEFCLAREDEPLDGRSLFGWYLHHVSGASTLGYKSTNRLGFLFTTVLGRDKVFIGATTVMGAERTILGAWCFIA